MSVKYSIHPYAEIFDLMQGPEMKAFTEDLKTNGIMEPVILLDGQILDGRNRAFVADKYDLKLPTIEYADYLKAANLPPDHDPLQFVMSKNLDGRRHLNETQRGFAAARYRQKIAERVEEANKAALKAAKEAAEQQKAAASNAGDQAPPPESNGKPPEPVLLEVPTFEEVAKVFRVSERTTRHADKVEKNCAKPVVAAAMKGEIAVSDAAAISKLPKAQQTAALAKKQAGESKTLRRAAGLQQEQTPVDAIGQEVPARLRDLFVGNPGQEAKEAVEKLAKFVKGNQRLFGSYLKLKEFQEATEAFLEVCVKTIPHVVHSDCDGKGCSQCGSGTGWVPVYLYEPPATVNESATKSTENPAA